MSRELQSVSLFARNRGFTESQVRHLLQRRLENGMSKLGAAIQLGRRVLIDPAKFDAWVDSIQPKLDRAA
jgi:hypothetical protein